MSANATQKLIITGVIFFLIALFTYLSPYLDDWEVFYLATKKIILRENPYTLGSKYLNPPWLAIFIMPVVLFPIRLAWAIVAVVSLIIAMSITNRWGGGRLKMITTLLSPPVFYILLHGQIDLLIAGGVFLPRVLWPIVALTKPQVAIGLVFGLKKSDLLKATLVTATIILISLLWLDLWPVALSEMHKPRYESQNVLGGLWPFQIVIAILLLVKGMEQKDERYLFASSPFFMPYAALSSYIFPWLAINSYLKNWQSFCVFVTWWVAVAYRAF